MTIIVMYIIFLLGKSHSKVWEMFIPKSLVFQLIIKTHFHFLYQLVQISSGKLYKMELKWYSTNHFVELLGNESHELVGRGVNIGI